jgi:uncharacterized protein (DUF58 family)
MLANYDPSLSSEVADLIKWRFHVKHLKLGHHQTIIAINGGQHATPRKGRGMEFNEVRPYQIGDDLRHIDWKISARTQKTHTKLYNEEHERPVIFIVEQSPGLLFASKGQFKTVLALNACAQLGWAALNQGDRVGGCIVGGDRQIWFQPKRQTKPFNGLLQEGTRQQHNITRPGQTRPEAWDMALERVNNLAHPASRIILIGDLFSLNDKAWRHLSELARHCAVGGLHLTDPLEQQLPIAGLLKLFDGQGELQLDARTQKSREAYQRYYEQNWQNLKKRFRSINAGLTALSTHEASLNQLLKAGWLRK